MFRFLRVTGWTGEEDAPQGSYQGEDFSPQHGDHDRGFSSHYHGDHEFNKYSHLPSSSSHHLQRAGSLRQDYRSDAQTSQVARLVGAARLDRQSLRCTRRKDRESVRQELATIDQEDLQLCFVNEIASDDEGGEESSSGASSHHHDDISLVGEQIARMNISEKAGQIIVPIYGKRIELDEWSIGQYYLQFFLNVCRIYVD